MNLSEVLGLVKIKLSKREYPDKVLTSFVEMKEIPNPITQNFNVSCFAFLIGSHWLNPSRINISMLLFQKQLMEIHKDM